MSTWPTTTYNGKEYYVSDGVTLIDPTTGAAVVMLKPGGGFAIGLTPIEVGPPGRDADIDEAINFTALDPTDPSPGSASWTQLRPSTDTDPALYKLNLALRTGQDGADGTTTITPSDYGTPVAKQGLIVNDAGTAFTLAYQRVGGRHYPAAFANAASGDTNKTLGTVSISSGTYNFDYRVEVEAWTMVTGTGPNVVVDLVARLTNETSGNEIGRCAGIGGVKDRPMIVGGLSPANAATDGWDRIAAGSGCTVHLRTEKQSGSDNYTTSSDTTRFVVKVRPIL